MKVFFDYNNPAMRSVSASAAQDTSLGEALRVLSTLRRERSFMGVMIAGDQVLQFYVTEPGTVWIEILDRQVREATGALGSLPIAEQALRACYEGQGIKAALEPYLLDWKVEQI